MRNLFAGLACAFVLCQTMAKAEGTNCSNGTLNGSYGLHATGSTGGVDNFAAVGRFSFDGKGGLTAKLFIRIDGSNVTVTITGTYSVNPDCTMTDVWNSSNGNFSTHQAVIVNDGKGYVIFNSTVGDGSVISGEATRQ